MAPHLLQQGEMCPLSVRAKCGRIEDQRSIVGIRLAAEGAAFQPLPRQMACDARSHYALRPAAPCALQSHAPAPNAMLGHPTEPDALLSHLAAVQRMLQTLRLTTDVSGFRRTGCRRQLHVQKLVLGHEAGHAQKEEG